MPPSLRPILVASIFLAGTGLAGATPGDRLADLTGVRGGLVVLVGTGDADLAVALARSGRYLVQALEREAGAVDSFREKIGAAGLYGLASAEGLDPSGKLPCTEDLVNLLVIGDAAAGQVSPAEAVRVLCPGGALLLSKPAEAPAGVEAAALPGGDPETERWRLFRKPRPSALDEWSHPRHGPDGNPVSLDTGVAPPRRIRWVAGPQEEISNLISAGGRNFHAGVYARDSFNGLFLWERKLTPSPARGGFGFALQAGGVPPVSSGDRLFVVTDGKVLALDAATGTPVREYAVPRKPAELVHEGGVLLAIDPEGIHALESASGKLLWSVDAVEPRFLAAGGGSAYFIRGPVKGGSAGLSALDLATGYRRWQLEELAWLGKVRRLVHHGEFLACEVSSLADDGSGNTLHLLSAVDGRQLWERTFTPWMAHYKQARAMFVDDAVWIVEEVKKGRGACVALDPRTGRPLKQFPANVGHCFPPVASVRYLFTGEMDPVDLATGKLEPWHLTKGACSRDAGMVLANGLIYAAPKHCRCWPMLRDFCAMAPARPGGDAATAETPLPVPEAGLGNPAWLASAGMPGPAPDSPLEDPAVDWPCYRHDALRSAGTPGRVPVGLSIVWEARLGELPSGPIAEDWRSNYFVRGPVGPPVAAGGLVFVARPDAHQVAAFEASTGKPRWTFTAEGRVDTAPTIHRGLCLFGTRSGHVHALRADDGRPVWRLRAAPVDERIVAYGQLESPWPVPGSILIADDLAWFAAGRQALADGGILLFCVDPRTGAPRWMRRLDSVPQTNFYASTAQDFENFDLLHREGDQVAMSRWLFDRADGRMSCLAKSGFARLGTGKDSVMFPRATWSYAPPDVPEGWKERPYVRPLMAFQGRTLYGSPQGRDSVFRRDFDLEGGETFDTDWYSGWDVAGGKLDVRWRSDRISKKARWAAPAFSEAIGKQPISALVLTAGALYAVSARGRLAALSLEDGKPIEELAVPPPAWDGLAAAGGRLFLSTQDGRLVCLAAR